MRLKPMVSSVSSRQKFLRLKLKLHAAEAGSMKGIVKYKVPPTRPLLANQPQLSRECGKFRLHASSHYRPFPPEYDNLGGRGAPKSSPYASVEASSLRN